MLGILGQVVLPFLSPLLSSIKQETLSNIYLPWVVGLRSELNEVGDWPKPGTQRVPVSYSPSIWPLVSSPLESTQEWLQGPSSDLDPVWPQVSHVDLKPWIRPSLPVETTDLPWLQEGSRCHKLELSLNGLCRTAHCLFCRFCPGRIRVCRVLTPTPATHWPQSFIVVSLNTGKVCLLLNCCEKLMLSH